MSHIGLFIDLDNAQLEADRLQLAHCRTSALWVGALVAELERVCGGVVSVRRAYGDALLNAGRVFREQIWKASEIRDEINADVNFQTDLFYNGFQMIHCPTVGQRKNRADILMALDCMELASTASHIDAFAVVSQDSDFSSLLHRLRALGKEVILVTVGKPRGHSWRALEALSGKWIVYDQSVIDRAGFEPFKDIVNKLTETEGDALQQGIPLSAVKARIEQSHPKFTCEAVGFRQFSEFVEACVEELPVICKQNVLRLEKAPAAEAPAPLPSRPTPAIAQGDFLIVGADVPALSTSGPPPAQVALPPSTREQRLLASLRKQNLRPLPELRREIGRWLRDEIDNDRPGIFAANGSPKAPLIYGDLTIRLQDRFNGKFSKSQVNDALQVLSMSGVIKVNRTEGLPIRNSPVSSLALPETSRTQIVSFLVQRLLGAGEVLTDSDVPPLTRVIFGTSDDKFLRMTKDGLEVAKSREETDDPADPEVGAATPG